MMTALSGPPATGQMINTNVHKHYPTSKYLKHALRDLCLVGDDQCSAPSRPPGSPRSRWWCTCPCRRRRHMMFRDIDSMVKYCFEASLCLSCFTAGHARQLLCWQSASASVGFAPIFYVCLPFIHFSSVCETGRQIFHIFTNERVMRWWDDEMIMMRLFHLLQRFLGSAITMVIDPCKITVRISV